MNKFNYETLNELLDDAKNNGYSFPVSGHAAETLGQELKLDGKSIHSRILAQPVEGFDAELDGAPGTRTLERYKYLVSHGFSTLWLESVSVSEQGRSNPAQLWITEQNVNKFKEMADVLRAKARTPVYLIVQLTHSGRYSNPKGIPTPICAFSNPFIQKENEQIISDKDIRLIEEDYVKAALLAEQAGFDAVDIRACHGYLLNEFFSAYQREGFYGGSFENRTRFYLETIDKVKEAVTSIAVGTRINMYDGIPYPYGWGTDMQNIEGESLTEPLRLIKKVYERGINLLNITSGTGAYSPFVIRPYDSGGKKPDETQFAGINRMLTCARQVKKIAPEAIVVASAFTWLREFGPDIAAGCIEENWFDIAGFGRQTIAYPEMAEDLFEHGGLNRDKCCRTCCGCTALIKDKGENVRCIFRK